jgi:spermidine synthase
MIEVAPRPPLISVALLSSAALAAEILLTRLFAVVHWHHFAYMIISLALLGFGASGTFLALAHRRLLRQFATSYLVNGLAFAACVVVGPVVARSLPFQAEALLWDPWQPLWLVLMFLVLMTPFFCAANAIGLALIAWRARVGRVYAADLAGAGSGSLIVLASLYRLWPEDVLRLVAATGLVAVCVGALELRARPAAWLGAAALALVAVLALPDTVLKFEAGPYKGLSQALLVDGTRIVVERSSPLGRVTVIESPRVPLRSAPGLSLVSTSEPPSQLGLFTDGDDLQAVTAASDDATALAFLEQTTSALAYRIAAPRTVLVVGMGGGMEILRARHFGARHVDAVEQNPQVADLLREDFRDYTGGLLDDPAVELYVGDARGFLSTRERRYDLIQMSLTGGGGGGFGGLNEDYLHTVEAVELYLQHLAADGFLSITRWGQVPPRDSLKLVATVVAALEASGAMDVHRRLLMIRGWQTATLLVKNGTVTPRDVQRARATCDALSFDVVWFPGIRPADVNTYNQLAEPWYYDGVRALLGSGRDDFIAEYAFDIRPATDDRPYFGNFFRWPGLVDAWQAKDRGGMALLEAGYVVLAGTLVLAVLAALVLILLPLALFAPLVRADRKLRWRVLAYFGAIGLAFLFVEIAFLQNLVLLVHHPTIALALVLATFLLGAGAGSAWSGRIPLSRSRRALGAAVLAVVVLGAVLSVTFDALIVQLAGASTMTRALAGAGLLAPLAFCMGLPFPLALRALEEPFVPWAWGINGCASVVGAVLATLLAVDIGFSGVLWIALALYVAALAASGFTSPRAASS